MQLIARPTPHSACDKPQRHSSTMHPRMHHDESRGTIRAWRTKATQSHHIAVSVLGFILTSLRTMRIVVSEFQ